MWDISRLLKDAISDKEEANKAINQFIHHYRRYSMKFRLLVLIVVLVMAASTAFSNGLSLNSIGPKGFGMGGAFVGLANDYSSLYWNPSGLTQIQKNFIGIFATDVIPMGTYKFSMAGIDTKTKVNHYISPNIMGSFSFTPSNDLVIGLGVYVPAGLGSEWYGSSLRNLGMGVAEWMSKIGVINISPAIAYRINENISVGLAVNIFYGMFDLKRPGGTIGSTTYQYSESSNGLGYGVTLGALVKANEMFSFGASLRTKTNVKMSGTVKNQYLNIALGAPAETDFDRDVAWPMWIGAGVACHPFDFLVITADAQYSQWSKSENEFTATYDNPIWQAALSAGGSNKFVLHWKDVVQYRVGIGYTFMENIDFRLGYYYDPAPAPDESYNILFPNITYNAITFGMGYRMDDWTFDGGIEYLMGQDRTISAAANPKAMPGIHGMDIWSWSLGVGYGF
jgi:long-chain fatty acid transport protein